MQLSFYQWNMISPTMDFVGLENYRSIVTERAFLQILFQSVLYIALAIIGIAVIPAALAWLTLKFGEREIDVFQTLVFFPTIVAVAVGAVVWTWFYLPRGGLINTILERFLGVSGFNWLRDSSTVVLAVSVVANWKFMGFNYLIALAGFRAISPELIDSGKVDGANAFQRLFSIELPLFVPTALFLFVTTIIKALEYAFVPVQVMTRGGPHGTSSHLMYAVYREAFHFFRTGRSGAYAMILIIFMSVFVVLQYRMTSSRVSYEH